MTETPDEAEPDLYYLASRMDSSQLDVILVEGFKHDAIAKIMLFRKGGGQRGGRVDPGRAYHRYRERYTIAGH